MKKFAIVMMLMLPACAVKMPGTRDAQVEQVRLLTHAIEKQADVMAVLAGKPTPSPSPSPSPSPAPTVKQEDDPDAHYGEEPMTVIAARRIK